MPLYVYYIIYILSCQKNASGPKPAPSPSLCFTPSQLLTFFVQLLPGAELWRLPALRGRTFYQRLFTPLVCLWYLLFQRLHPDHTLDAALADARSGGADRLNKKLSRALASHSTCSYSGARQRLPWQFVAQALRLQGTKIIGLSPTVLWQGRTLALLDGSTVRLRPHGKIAQEFPGNSNQHGKAYWCILRVTVCFCGLCGAVLDCAMGSIHLSEQVMACRLILGSAGKLLFIGDRNFGVFRVVQTARHAGQEVLLRLTECRARRLLGGVLPPGEHAIIWEPTRQDQRQPGCNPKAVQGRLLVLQLRRPGFRSQQLYLFTTLPAQFGLQEAARLYGLRWHVELNLRYLKTQMDLVQLEAKSPDMARKEWLAGLMAYNLIRAAQLCAALAKKVSPLTLSFSSTRRRLEDWLRQWAHHPRQALRLWPQIIESIGHCRHPARHKGRPTEPRAQRHLRQPYAPLFGSRAQARRNLKKYASKS